MTNLLFLSTTIKYIYKSQRILIVGVHHIHGMARVLASQAEAIVDLGRTWPQHRIDIH